MCAPAHVPTLTCTQAHTSTCTNARTNTSNLQRLPTKDEAKSNLAEPKTDFHTTAKALKGLLARG